MQIFNRLVNWYVPESLKGNLHLYTRARMIAAGTISTWPVCVPILLILLLLFQGNPVLQNFTIMVTVGGIIIWAFILYLLRLTGSFPLCIHLLVSTGLGIITLTVYMTGGIQSPTIVAMIIPPIISALFTGRQSALAWCCICSFIFILFFAFEDASQNNPNLIPEHLTNAVRTIFLILASFAIVGFLYIYEEIGRQYHLLLSEEKQKLSSMAHHDDLTGLANRLQFNKHLNLAIELAHEENSKIALLYIDLDDFKPVNDIHGHEAGDQVLKIAAQRMNRCVRASDTVARIGGDEFAIILNGIDSRQRAEDIANNISAQMKVPMDIYDKQIIIGASTGVCIYPEDADCAQSLISAADEKMYATKRTSKR